jgi:protein-tyrosine phosphatase
VRVLDIVFANFRDIGGLPLVGGGRTRSGVLLRSSAPIPGTPLPESLGDPSFTVIDLRAPDERPRYEWPESAVVHRHNLFEPGDLNKLVRTDLVVVYRDMLAAAAQKIAAVTEMLSQAGPTVIHCTAGKDRTGVTIAVLLLLAGVDPAAITADYRSTEKNMPMVVDGLGRIGVVEIDNISPLWLSAPEAAIALVLDTLQAHPGGPQAWYTDHGGEPDALARLRSRLRTDTDADQPGVT